MLKFLCLLFFSFSALNAAAESLSYSGRLVNADGSPVTGPVNIQFNLSYTDAPTTVICSKTVNGVGLTNGVFHTKIDYLAADCGGDTLTQVMASVPANETVAMQVTDVTNSKAYTYQAVHAIPNAVVSNIAKTLVQMGAAAGQALIWDGTKWGPSAIGTGNGTVTSVATGTGLTGGPITTTGTISIANGGVDTTQLAASAVTDAKVSATAAIARTKLASGTASHVIVNDGSGVLSSVAVLPLAQGGTNANTAAGARTSLGLGTAAVANIGTALGDVMGASVVPNCLTSEKLSMTAGPVYTWACIADSTTDATKLPLAGGTMTGDIAMGTNKILNAGAIAIGAAAVDASSVLDLTSTTKGMLIPRMTTVQRDAIASPATGLQIYNTTTGAINFYNGSAWTSVSSGSSVGDFKKDGTVAMTGNIQLNGNYLSGDGGSEGVFVNATGSVGIGTALPGSALDVNGTINARGGFSTSGNVGTVYTPTSAALTWPYSAASTATTVTISNTQATDATGSFAQLRARNTSGNLQDSYIGAISSSGAGVYAPAIVFGQQTGATAYSERMRIDTSGHVGIGTDAPAATALLDLSSTSLGMLAPRMTTAQRDAITSPATGLFIYNTSTNAFNFHNGTAWTGIAAGGSVGDFKTDGSVAMTGPLVLSGGAVGAPGLTFSGNTNTGIYSTSANNLMFTTNGTQRMTLDGSGNLLVTGAFTNFNGFSTQLFNNTAYVTSSAAVNTPGGIIGNFNNNNIGNDSLGAIEVSSRNSSSNTQRAYFGAVSNAGAGAYTPSIVIGAQTGATAYAERMRIDSNGNVGIGTNGAAAASALLELSSTTKGFLEPRMTTVQRDAIASPATGLSVYNTTTNTQNYYNGSTWMTLSSLITGTGAGTAMAADAVPNCTAAQQLQMSVGPVYSWSCVTPAQDWTLSGSDVYRSSGNVGIGATPTAKLDVQGGSIRSVDTGGTSRNNAAASVDWSKGNNQSMSVACTTTTFTNMLDGATYNLAVTETTATTCTFSQAGLTFYYAPANGSRIAATRTMYSFTRIGTDVYVSWSSLN